MCPSLRPLIRCTRQLQHEAQQAGSGPQFAPVRKDRKLRTPVFLEDSTQDPSRTCQKKAAKKNVTAGCSGAGGVRSSQLLGFCVTSNGFCRPQNKPSRQNENENPMPPPPDTDRYTHTDSKRRPLPECRASRDSGTLPTCRNA